MGPSRIDRNPLRRSIGAAAGAAQDRRHAIHRPSGVAVVNTVECDPYGDVSVDEMFRGMAALEPHSAAWTRQRQRIVELCLPLADNIARRFEGRGEPRDDLVQVARIGLMKAVTRYDVAVGSGFVAFAVPTIMGEVRRYFRDNCWSLKVPRRYKDLQPRLKVATDALAQRFGRPPTASELAAELGMPREEVIDALLAASAYRTRRVDSGPDGLAPEVWDAIAVVDDNLDQIDDREALRPLLIAMPTRERAVLQLRFGEMLSQAQIAARIGISQTHVSRLLAKSLQDMRTRLCG